jgi:autoinducer 2-binding periplasmic protein LuxP
MWYRLAITALSLFFSSSLYAIGNTSTQHYLTYKEFSSLYSQKQNGTNEFASRIRKNGERYKGDQNRPIRIAIIYPGRQASDYWQRSLSSFEARLAESQVPYEIHSHFSQPGKELKLQEEQIAAALKNDPDYLIFTLDATKHQRIIERLITRKRPKVILQNITTPLGQWGNTQPFMYVGFDHGTGTELLADEYLRRFERGGKYAIFYGLAGYVSQMRGGTFKSLMHKRPKMELVAEYYTGFNRNKAYEAATHLLKNQPSLQFIYSCSTDIALGVMDAIKEQGRENQVVTNGWGGGRAELQAIKNHKLDLTVMRMNDDNGVAMAEAILWQSQGRQTPTVYSGDMHLVTKEMSSQKIEQLSNRAFRYSDRWVSHINTLLKSDR